MKNSLSRLFGGRGGDRRGEYLDPIPTPVIAMDRGFSITYINPAGAGLCGRTPEELRGKKCYDLFKTSHCNTRECRCASAP